MYGRRDVGFLGFTDLHFTREARRLMPERDDHPPVAPHGEQGNPPPPLPAPHVEALRWQGETPLGEHWNIVTTDGALHWQWKQNAGDQEWSKATYNTDEARRRLAAEVVALRARVDELQQAINGHGGWSEVARGERTARHMAEQRVDEMTALVETAYREGYFDGRRDGNVDEDWLDSDARKALIASAEKGDKPSCSNGT